MLEPRDRSLLFESLRPPIGYRLDAAVGTTFSLDLMTLLTLPLAFTLFDWTDEEGRPKADPLALLESVRRAADRMTVFCQAGRIAVPPRQLLLSNLEDSIVQVSAPREGGVFHPKLWIVRFVPSETADEELSGGTIVYRLLCASRNITFDRSWDTMLVLEGNLSNHPRSLRINRPLASFVAQLPNLALPGNSTNALERARELAARMGDELHRVEFELPDGFDDFRFWPLGIDDSPWPFGEWVDRLAIVSPFLSDSMLKRLADQAGEVSLVSRVESLEGVKPSLLKEYENVLYMDPGADAEDVHEGVDAEDGAGDDGQTAQQGDLSGLHAKIFVADLGSTGRVWTGSANATSAALNRNVEFLVELQGRKHLCGVDAFLGIEGDGDGFRNLLLPFSPDGAPPPDSLRERLEKRLEELRRELSSRHFCACAGPAESTDKFNLTLSIQTGESLQLAEDVAVRCWPITLQEEAGALALPHEFSSVTFKTVSFEALTSFFAFHCRTEEKGTSLEQRFVINVPLEGCPENRHDRLLLSILRDRNQVLHYLFLLLADDGTETRGVLDVFTRTGQTRRGGHEDRFYAVPLLEPLIQALARDPAKLDRVHRLVEDLRKTEEGRQRLPDGFEEVWRPIWQARQHLGGKS